MRKIIKAHHYDRIAKWIDLLRHYSHERGFQEGQGTVANPRSEAVLRFHRERVNKAYSRLWDAIRAIEDQPKP